MRTPSYISPSALKVFMTNPETYYMQYLCETRLPKDPQTIHMAVGSAFDAYVKSFLYQAMFGRADKFDFDTLFNKQVEEQNREDARGYGAHVFDIYKQSGQLFALLKELENALTTPRFEDTLEGEIEGVKLLGKPDLYFISKEGVRVILDWKVNGYFGRSNTSPKPGYTNLWPKNVPHKDCFCKSIGGIAINIATTMDKVDEDWATQLSTYAWLLGEAVGSPFVGAIDQFCGTGKRDTRDYPELRIANHRLRVDSIFQTYVLNNYKKLWNAIQIKHIFTNMTLVESRARCEELEAIAASFDLTDDMDKKFLETCR